MSNFDLAATVAYVDANSMPEGSYGCVYELWQEARNREAYSLLGHVPDEHYDATVMALKAKGVIEEVGQPPEGLCQHWLDANTCPCGCFEGEEPEPVIEDHGDRHDPYELYGLGHPFVEVEFAEAEEDEEEPDWDEMNRLEAELDDRDREEEREARAADLAAKKRTLTFSLLCALGLTVAAYLLG